MVGLMDGVNGFSSFLSIGTTLDTIFAPSSDSAVIIAALQQMLNNLLTEVEQVFSTDLTDSAVATAAGVAQSAHDFLAVDYANAQRAGMTRGELWALLTSDTSTARLPDLVAQASTMLTWATTNQAMAQQTTALAFTIYSLIVALHRERARNAPDDATRAAEWADAKEYAALAQQRLHKAVSAFLTIRSAALTPPNRSAWTLNPGGREAREIYMRSYTVQDTWLFGSPPGQPGGTVLAVASSSEQTQENPQVRGQIDNAYTLYRQICCQGGPEASLAAWSQTLTAVVNAGYFIDANVAGDNLPSSGPVIQRLLPSLMATGRWLYNANATLNNFSAISGPAAVATVDFSRPSGTLLTNATLGWGDCVRRPAASSRSGGPGCSYMLSRPEPIPNPVIPGWLQMTFVLVAVPEGDVVLTLRWIDMNPIGQPPASLTVNGAPVAATFMAGPLPTWVTQTIVLPMSPIVPGSNTVQLKMLRLGAFFIQWMDIAIDPQTYLRTSPTTAYDGDPPLT